MPYAGSDPAHAALLAPPTTAVAETRHFDLDPPDLSEQQFMASLEASTTIGTTHLTHAETPHQAPPSVVVRASESFADPSSAGSPLSQAPEDASAWREEVSARLSQYRSRRKVRPPRYPSLRLPFEEPSHGAELSGSVTALTQSFGAVSNQALARDWTEPVTDPAPAGASPVTGMSAAVPSASRSSSSPHAGAKIIEFPRSAEIGPPLPFDELAEPVTERPRILDVPEVAPPLPALGGITMEADQRTEAEKRPGLDTPLQRARLARRLLAAAIDGLIIMAASALFGFVFWKIAAIRPPLLQLLGLAAGIPTLLWAAYQYLLIVYSGSTPGLRVSSLEINCFDGTLTNRRLRRWRVLASCLSAASLGMGYAWVFLDEDSLCWHDRITHTYLAPRTRTATTLDAAAPLTQ